MRLRILFVTDATFLSTGYATYCREIMRRLHAVPQFELGELSLYCKPDDPRIKQIPWQIFPNLPSNPQEQEIYDSNPVNPFGAWKFESVCINFRPHCVLCPLDFWMYSYQITSPLRHCYHLINMPAVDSNYQNPQWIEGYCRADAICSYTDWAIQIMRELSGGRVRVIGNTSPAANDNFKPVDNKFEHKKKYGLENFKIVGTVMRNQKRKLFPDLFQAFRLFLDGSERKDVLLYCHTGYPDRTPWNIPELLNEYGIAHKVLFTYKCNPAMGGCGFSFPSFFGDYRKVCPRCRGFSATTADVHNGVDDNFLCDLYNLFDLYIQYAALESFGMPAVEAGACGTPVMIIDFSGMSEIVRKLEGIPLPPLTLNKELETGRLWAIPDNNWTALKLEEFFNLSDEQRAERSKKTRENYLTHFSYDRSAQVLANHFGSLNMEELERRWYSPPRIKEPAQLVKQCESMSNLEFTKWCIYEVMGEPSYLYGYWHSRMLKDLNFGCHTMGIGGNYFNDNAMMCSENNLKNFTRQDLYNICEGFGKNRNYWERVRKEVIK